MMRHQACMPTVPNIVNALRFGDHWTTQMLAQKFRLQNSPYFCVFKYAWAVKQKVWNEAENRERDCEARSLRTRKTLRHALPIFFTLYLFWEKNRLFAVYQKFDLFQTLRNNTQQHATGCANGRKFTSSLSLIMLYYPYSKNTETEVQ